MSFYKKLQQYKDFDFDDFFSKVTARDIEKILCKDILHEMDFLKLLSPAAEKYLEHMAQKLENFRLRILEKQWCFIHLYILLIIV